MDEKNYEDILQRRQERWKDEKKRRRRKVMLVYLVILAAVVAAGIFGYGILRRRHVSAGETVYQDGTADGIQSPADAGTVNGEAADAGSADTEDKDTGVIGRFFSWLGDLFGQDEKGILVNPGQVLNPDGSVPGGNSGDGERGKENGGNPEDGGNSSSNSDEAQDGSGGQGEGQPSSDGAKDGEEAPATLEALLARAERLAAGYDYEGAIALIQENEEFSGQQQAQDAVSRYQEIQSGLVEQDVNQVTHVFFHSLVIDTAKAFDGDSDANGYNQVMTTKDEFEKILNEMYNRGFVLVRLHDLAHEETDENGNTRMVKGKILLPEGKKAFVMSQDDVCYYPYMDGDGFASRIVIGEDGKPTCEMVLEDGTAVTGEFDLVPILERFIQEHPDFSYKGARAVLAFTGYEGILGYRTAASYQDSPTYEEDRRQAAEVAQCLRDNGWELASHSWGHRYLGQLDMDSFRIDTDKWENEVETLIGPTDIILYPFGDDISDWHPYTADNQKYQYLREKGFRYFCTVDSSQYWVQISDDCLRQGRRNLDGYRMWQDIAAAQEGGSGVRRLDDLFRAEDVFDPARPTPVVWN